ncbi:hypothetical protein TRICI_004659 [Trichomonascus ciferrii]|uniref:Shugoshin C-terminal domain-containing protein n=1 Tax=Trichomonascus ciferrii TaxID=44093 RepID=A0A642V088_9ASCO|nr:hypothetical protein TRICI_004659 [Trichomonascus ciferrii]
MARLNSASNNPAESIDLIRRRFGSQNRAIAKAHAALEDKVSQLEKCNDDLLKENYQLRCENMRLRKGQVVSKNDILSKLREVERMLLDDNEEMKVEEPQQVQEVVVSTSRPLDTITRRKPRTEMVDTVNVDECDTAMIEADSEYSSSRVIHDVITEVDEVEAESEDEVLADLENEKPSPNEIAGEENNFGEDNNENFQDNIGDGMDASINNEDYDNSVQEADTNTHGSIEEEKKETTSAPPSSTNENDTTPVLSPAKKSHDETPVSLSPTKPTALDSTETNSQVTEQGSTNTPSVEETSSIKKSTNPQKKKRSSSSLSPSKKPKKAPKRSSTRTVLEPKSINTSPQKSTPAPKQPASSPPRRRSRGNQVNYALPSLRTKMRRQKDGLAAAIDD